MIYRVIGLMSGSSLDGIDIVFAEFNETGGQWLYRVLAAGCEPYSNEWKSKLLKAKDLKAADYLALDTQYGRLTGQLVNKFILEHQLEHQVHLVVSHGHTVFHEPAKHLSAQLGDGASIAAITGLTVVSNLRSMDVALGGQGAPIVPMGERLLFPAYSRFLNIGGIANISFHTSGLCHAYDICPANRILNMLAAETGKEMDEGGAIARTGSVLTPLLEELNRLEYYSQKYPKSLDNRYGTDIIYPIIQQNTATIKDALRTYTEHIALQVASAVAQHETAVSPILITGGGAFNSFLIERIQAALAPLGIEGLVPEKETVQYKEAIIMGLLGILRWRESATVLTSGTGASRSSSGGAMWLGG